MDTQKTDEVFQPFSALNTTDTSVSPNHPGHRSPLVSTPADKAAGSPVIAKNSTSEGFSLVEAMIATLVLAFLALSIFTGLIFSYKLAAKTRYRDHARYILKSIGDEFLTRQAENKLGNFNPLFEPTPTGPTGDGVFWNGVVGTSGDTAGLQVTLGTSTGALITNARVTRDVRYLSNSGTVTDTPPAGTAGIMLRGDFRIRYVFDNIPVEQNVSLVRRVP